MCNKKIHRVGLLKIFYSGPSPIAVAGKILTPEHAEANLSSLITHVPWKPYGLFPCL